MDRGRPERSRAARLAIVAAVLLALAGVGTSVATTQSTDASIVARYPADDGSMVEKTVVTSEDVASVSDPRVSRTGDWQVPVTLTESGAESFRETMVDSRFTSDAGVTNCPPKRERNDEGYCLLTVVDGEVVYAAGITSGFADHVESGEFVENPRFVMLTTNESRAEQIVASFGVNTTTGPTTSSTSTTTVETTPQTTSDSRTTTAGGSGPVGGDSGNGGIPGFGASTMLAALVLSLAAALVRRQE